MLLKALGPVQQVLHLVSLPDQVVPDGLLPLLLTVLRELIHRILSDFLLEHNAIGMLAVASALPVVVIAAAAITNIKTLRSNIRPRK